MATISSPPHSSSSASSLSPVHTTPSDGGGGEVKEDELDQQNELEFNSLVKEKHQRAQFRIVEVPLSASFSSSQHSTILVGLSGLISDATSLLQIIYSQLEQEQRSMSWHRLGLSPIGVNKIADESGGHGSMSTQSSQLSRRRNIMYQSIFAQPSETVLRLSRAIADECQKHAFGGGLRPFGASLLIAGVDSYPAISNKGNTAQSSILGARVSMCETFPNGGWRNSVSSNVQNNNNKSNDRTSSSTRTSFQIMISGGSLQSQRSLKIMLTSRLHKSNYDGNDESLFLHQVLQIITISLVEEWQNRGSHSSSSSTATELLESMKKRLTTAIPQMEIVISSSKRGTHRLTEKDVSRLLKI
jgi:hypothetical protein